MAKKAAPKAAQGKAAPAPATKAGTGKAAPAPATKAAPAPAAKAAPAPAAKAGTGKAAPAPATKVAPAPAAKAAPAPAAKAPPKPADTPTPDRPKPANKAVVYTALAETTGLGKKEVAAVFSALGTLIAKELGKKGPGQFVLPGLLKLKVVRKPATKARSRTNPFTGAPMTIPAKPARDVVRALPLKALKEMV
jgi:nucleoid DNA-binding protein